jgi:hypothetical protein
MVAYGMHSSASHSDQLRVPMNVVVDLRLELNSPNFSTEEWGSPLKLGLAIPQAQHEALGPVRGCHGRLVVEKMALKQVPSGVYLAFLPPCGVRWRSAVNAAPDTRALSLSTPARNCRRGRIFFIQIQSRAIVFDSLASTAMLGFGSHLGSCSFRNHLCDLKWDLIFAREWFSLPSSTKLAYNIYMSYFILYIIS